jgi:hypothetical protein
MLKERSEKWNKKAKQHITGLYVLAAKATRSSVRPGRLRLPRLTLPAFFCALERSTFLYRAQKNVRYSRNVMRNVGSNFRKIYVRMFESVPKPIDCALNARGFESVSVNREYKLDTMT